MSVFGEYKEKFYIKLRRTFFLENIDLKLAKANNIAIEDYLQRHLFGNPYYHTPDKLNRFEFQAFSQCGEDGIIEEIFRRIGTSNQYFVEFGVETGIETNSTYLLYKGWKGLWIDGSQLNINTIKKNFSKVLNSGHLNAIQSFITAENIEQLFLESNVPVEFDLLSIDIDRNDYYIWDAITHYQPRVVIIEYNSIFRPGCEFVVDYDANSMWDGTSNTGASLESLYQLGLKKGYILVASSFSGVNAFFVREDLIKDKFTGPFTPENHFESPKYFLYYTPGHPRKVML